MPGQRSGVMFLFPMMLLLMFSALPSTAIAQDFPKGEAWLACHSWNVGANDPANCELPASWWEAFPDCAITPVMTTPAKRKDLEFLPWFDVDMGQVTATAHLFFGNRPLPVGVEFPDKSSTKVLWSFSSSVHNLELTATSQEAGGLPNVPAIFSSGSAGGGVPSYIYVVHQGCWEFTLTAESTEFGPVSGKFTYVAVS